MVYLALLGKFQFAQVVVQLHHFRGFQVCRLARGGLVVYQAFDFAAVGVQHGNHHPTVADGHFGSVGCPSFVFGTGQLAVYLYIHLVAFACHLPPDF